MSNRKHTRQHLSSGWTWVFGLSMIAATVFLCFVLLPQLFDYHIGQVVVNGGMFPLELENNEDDVVSPVQTGVIDLYVNASPSMAGFVRQERVGCVPSSYNDLLSSLNQTLNAYVNVNIFYRGNVEQLANLKEVVEESTYDRAYNSESGLLTVLKAASTSSNISVIFTDLEGENEQTFFKKVEQCAQQIFQSGKSLSIGRFMSAFSGVLYNYAGSGTDYSYGVKERHAHTTRLMNASNYAHHQPRAFYVIVIADTATCEDYQSRMEHTYWAFCSLVTASNIGDHAAEDLEKYKGAQSYILSAAKAGSTSVNAANIETDLSGLWVGQTEAQVDTRWEVPQYNIPHTTDASAVCQIVYKITPDLSSSVPIVLSDNLQIDLAVQSVVEKNGTWESNEGESMPTNYLLGRGNRVLIYSLEDDQKAAEYITANSSIDSDGVIQVTLIIQNGNLEAGLYRIYLQATAKQNGRQTLSLLSNPLGQYSIDNTVAATYASALTRDNAYRTTMNPVENTIALNHMLQAIHDGYAGGVASLYLKIAYIVFDLYVVEE